MQLYIDELGRIKAEPLRQETLKQLRLLVNESEYLLSGKAKQFWDELHLLIVTRTQDLEKQAYLDIQSQLQTLTTYIETWIRTSVESRERWEFFVMAKAQEIQSGDKDKDYYWGLAIRHDQLIALIRVLNKLIGHMNRWVLMKPDKVMDDGVFWGLSEYPVEKQIYLEAEKVHREREKTTKGK